MRKLMMLIALLLGLMLFVPAVAEETAYTDMLAAWAEVPYGTQDIPVSLADCEAADLGLTEEAIGEETALCWRTGLGSVTFKVNVPNAGLYNIAIRFLPWLISHLGNLLGWICGKINTLFYVVRRECYKL